ncbi:MAG: tyrosine-type recombinase/integrase [Leucobacter sp.]
MIEKRENGSYRVRIYYRRRYVASRSFSRRRDAESWERQAKDALAAGRWIDPTKSEAVTVADWVEVWLKSTAGGAPSAVQDRAAKARLHVIPAFGGKPLAAVKHSDVAAWARNLAELRSPSTARRALAVLRRTYDLAIRDSAATSNPATGIKLPMQQAGEPYPLTHAELWRLADAMPSRKDRLLVLVAGYGGLRWGELTALQPRHIAANGAVRVMQAWSDVRGTLHLGDVKNHQARTVPLPRSVASELVEWSQDLPPSAFIFHASQPVIPLRNSNYRRRILAPALNQANLPPITPHNFRDTCASLAIQAGANVLAVSKLLGHKDPSVTLRHYASLFPNELDAVADRLERASEQARKRDIKPDNSI